MTTISFKKIPIYVSDSTSKYFLVDLLLPLPFQEDHIKALIQIITAMCNGLSSCRTIDVAMSNLCDRLPFSMFNYLYLPQPTEPTNCDQDTEQEQERVTQGFLELHINQTKIPVSML